MADNTNSTGEISEFGSGNRRRPRKTDSTSSGEDAGLPILGVVEPLSFETSGADKRGSQRLGWGEFEPADRQRSVEYVRYLFLWQIREAELSWRAGRKRLEVLKQLGGTPLIEFEKARPSEKQLRRLFANPRSPDETNLLALQKAVGNWARKWGLDAPWCLSTAYATLRLWSDYPKAREMLLWDSSFTVDEATSILPPEVADTAPFPGLPPFFAHIELRSAYTKRMKDRIRGQLEAAPLTARVGVMLQRAVLNADMREVKAYCDRVMGIYESQRDRKGRPVWKRVRERSVLERDLRWAVEFRVRGRSARAIALQEEIERNLGGSIQGMPHTTVTRGVNFILELMDLPPRTRTK